MLLNFEIISLSGRMHPLLVHLPIGILLAGFLLQWLSRKGKNPTLKPALLPIYLAGCITAILSCISGYILSLSGDYEESLLNIHQWMGIAVALTSLLLFLGIRGLRWFIPYTNFIAFILFAGIVYTAHLGGSLTHGSNFLFSSTSKKENTDFAFKPLPNAQEAVVYEDIIRPILQSKCYACHGPDKQKGKLRLDGKDNILKGGKDGKVITAPLNEQPEMLRRILLPPDDEDHMPPKEKGQLSERQVTLIKWWLNEGANFTAKSKELKQNDTIKKMLASLQEPSSETINAGVNTYPELPPAPKGLVDSLKNAGVMVIPLSRTTNALSVSLINITRVSDTVWSLLSRLGGRVYFLDASGPLTGNEAIESISKLTSLQKLSLANAVVTNEALPKLQSLKELVSLNLTGTKVDETGLLTLRTLTKLKNIYIYRSAVNYSRLDDIRMKFPGVTIDTGGYTMPLLTSDTTEVKPKKN
jgi:mono/diheme cytochrome c family protein/uncharacterized membrane protein